MEIVQPRPLIRRLLRVIEECGGVVDVFFAAVDQYSLAPEELHRRAASLGLEALKQRMDEQAEELARRYEMEYGTNPEHLFRVKLVPGHVPVGKRISTDEFMHGPRDSDPRELPEGFVHAFCDPPYGLRRANPMRLLSTFRRLVLHQLAPETEIWQWDTEGSNYFDAGKEWWGSFFWTVQPPPGRIIVALLASTTD